jgi:uncharacterized OB-fold protein
MGRPDADRNGGRDAIIEERIELTKEASVQPSGVPLKEDDIERQKVLTVLYYPKAKYAWATGIAVGRFLRGMKEGEIIGSKCEHCGRIVVPPRIFCEWCFRRSENWVKLPDTGVVNTYSISYITTDTTRVKTPTIPAVIEIDGTSNAGLLHLIGDVKPEDVKIGMRVKAVWLDQSKRTGSITDIKHFAPASR